MTPDNPHAAVSQRIEQLFPSLSPQLRQAAQYVLDRPDDVALQSMRSVAASAGVQPATMVRLAKALDYPGFEAFREPFRERLRHPATGYASRARALQARSRSVPDAPHGELLSEMLTADVANLRETYERIGFDTLARCGDELGAADRIFVAGLRSCYPLAFYFHYACHVFGAATHLVDGLGGTLADSLRGIGPKDAVLAISFAPYTRETVNIVTYAAGRGARVVVITDSAASPLAAVADHLLLAASRSPSFFQSIVAGMAVTQALVAILVARGDEQALAALEESEAQLHEFEAYWPDKGTRPGSRRSHRT